MKMGAEPKQIAALSVLGLVLGYVVYDNVLSGPSNAPIPVKSGVTAAPRPVVATKTMAPPSIAKKGRTAKEVAADLAASPRAVQDWVRWYNQGGLNSHNYSLFDFGLGRS